jgi:hypothetical protein
MRCAAVALIFRPRQDGQKPRPLQLNATSRVSSHPSAIEIALQLLLHELRKCDRERPVVHGVVERREVVCHNLVERRLLRSSTLVDDTRRRHVRRTASQGPKARLCNLATLRSAPPGRDGSSPGAGHLVAGHQPLDVRVSRLDALAHIASISTSRSFGPPVARRGFHLGREEHMRLAPPFPAAIVGPYDPVRATPTVHEPRVERPARVSIELARAAPYAFEREHEITLGLTALRRVAMCCRLSERPRRIRWIGPGARQRNERDRRHRPLSPHHGETPEATEGWVFRAT